MKAGGMDDVLFRNRAGAAARSLSDATAANPLARQYYGGLRCWRPCCSPSAPCGLPPSTLTGTVRRFSWPDRAADLGPEQVDGRSVVLCSTRAITMTAIA
jgi:hypothetical protein